MYNSTNFREKNICIAIIKEFSLTSLLFDTPGILFVNEKFYLKYETTIKENNNYKKCTELKTLEWINFNPDFLIRISTVETFHFSP